MSHRPMWSCYIYIHNQPHIRVALLICSPSSFTDPSSCCNFLRSPPPILVETIEATGEVSKGKRNQKNTRMQSHCRHFYDDFSSKQTFGWAACLTLSSSVQVKQTLTIQMADEALALVSSLPHCLATTLPCDFPWTTKVPQLGQVVLFLRI